MPTPQIPNISSNATLEELRDCYIGMVRYMTYLLSALDTLNINRLDAKVIVAESITTDKIQAGAVTAEKITVDELSAISADLGHITAGLIESIRIFGSYISTRMNSFPRAEMNSTNDLFGAYQDANNFIRMIANYAGTAAVEFATNNELIGRINSYLGTLAIEGYKGLTVSAYNGDLDLSSCDIVRIGGTDWSRVRNETGLSIQDDLDQINDELNGKATSGISTGYSGSANGGIPIGTKLAVEGGGFVTWTGIPSHTHAQN